MNLLHRAKHTWQATFLVGMILLSSLLVVALTLDTAPGSHVPLNHDSSMFYYFGQGIKHGLIPYRDMLDHKGPVLFLINALAAFLSFNTLHFGLFIIEIATIGGIFWFAYKTSELVTSNKVASGLTVLLFTPFMIFTLQGGNFSEEYALFFIISAIYYWALIWFEQPMRHPFLVYVYIGISCAAVFFIRANMVAFWLMLIVAAVWLTIRGKQLWQELGMQVLGFTVGFLALTGILCTYFALHGALTQMINYSFVMNIQYAQSSLMTKLAAANEFLQLMLRSGALILVILGLFTLMGERQKLKQNWGFFLILNFQVKCNDDNEFLIVV